MNAGHHIWYIKAQERNNRDLCALKLEGSNYMSDQAQRFAHMAVLDDVDITVDDIKHDLFHLASETGNHISSRQSLTSFASGGNGEPAAYLDLAHYRVTSP
jgi:hypothetical protein